MSLDKPGGEARRDDPETAQEAAARAEAQAQRLRVMIAVADAGERGLTPAEIEEVTGIEFRSVTPRVGYLKRGGFIAAHGKRPGDHGRDQQVLVLTPRGAEALRERHGIARQPHSATLYDARVAEMPEWYAQAKGTAQARPQRPLPVCAAGERHEHAHWRVREISGHDRWTCGICHPPPYRYIDGPRKGKIIAEPFEAWSFTAQRVTVMIEWRGGAPVQSTASRFTSSSWGFLALTS